MIRRNIFGFAMVIVMMAGSTYGQDNGHGTHTAGTIGAIGNNGVYEGGGAGRDVLIGGGGYDRTSAEQTDGGVTSYTGLEILLRNLFRM